MSLDVHAYCEGFLNGYPVNVNVVSGGGGGTTSEDETTFIPGISLGTPIMGVVNPIDTPPDGTLAIAALDSNRKLQIAGTFTTSPTKSNICTGNPPSSIGTTSTLAITSNINRKRLILQNTGTTNLYVLLGVGTASATNYTFILRAGGNINDGSSPIWIDDLWTGEVQWCSSNLGGQGVINECT